LRLIESFTMKKPFLIALIFCSLYANASDQNNSRKTGRVRSQLGLHLNLLPIAFGTYTIHLEYYLNQEMSILSEIGYRSRDQSSITFDSIGRELNDEYRFSGFLLSPEFRFHFNPSRQGNDGLFVGAYLRYHNYRSSGEDFYSLNNKGNFVSYDKINNDISTGFTLGRTRYYKSGLALSYWFGMGAIVLNSESRTKDFTINPSWEANLEALKGNSLNLEFRASISIGYRF
jgi:hypothetical protein